MAKSNCNGPAEKNCNVILISLPTSVLPLMQVPLPEVLQVSDRLLGERARISWIQISEGVVYISVVCFVSTDVLQHVHPHGVVWKIPVGLGHGAPSGCSTICTGVSQASSSS